MKQITEHTGNKYVREIHSCISDKPSTIIDVYEIFQAYNVTLGPIQHAIKKLLCPGARDKGSALQDINEAIDALYRAVDILKRDS